ncbi:hypothetical protein Tco_1478150 [Tanacetum coccineum]
MKFVILFLVSVLVFGFTSPSLSTSILTVDDDVVLDYDGNPLEKDASYFIVLPGSRALGGPLRRCQLLQRPPRNEGSLVVESAKPAR